MSLELQLKLDFKQMKRMKKLYGSLRGREIAFGRKMIKLMNTKYQPERSKREDLKDCIPVIQLWNGEKYELSRCGTLNSMET